MEIESKRRIDHKYFGKKLKKALKEDPTINTEDEEYYANYMDKYYDDKYDINDKSELRKRYKLYQKSRKRLKKLRKRKARLARVNNRIFESKYGETIFMDWTDEEIERLFHHNHESHRKLLSITTECDIWPGMIETNERESLDVYNHCNTPIHDQGPHNTCWVFGALGQAECNYNFQKNKSLIFSPQHILDCTDDSIGTALNGGRGDKIIEWAQDNGFCSNYYYEYEGKDYEDECAQCESLQTPMSCAELDDPMDHDKITKTANFYALAFPMYLTEDFLYLNGEDATYFGCDNDDEDDDDEDNDSTEDENKIIGSHSMTIVGQYFGKFVKVKNSWTSKWGDNGYIWIDINAITGSCKRKTLAFTMNFFGWE